MSSGLAVILVDDESLEAWRIEPDQEVTVGRNPQLSSITLTDATVSRRHVGMKATANGLEFVDVPGTAATYVGLEPARRGTVADFGAVVGIGRHQLIVLSSDWLQLELPGELPASPIADDPEYGRRLAAWVEADVKTPDDGLWCTLYLRWRAEVVRHEGDARRMEAFDWVFSEASRMASARVLSWLGERLRERDRPRWFFGRRRRVLRTLVFADDAVGPLVANELAESGHFAHPVGQLFDERTAGGNAVTFMLDLVDPSRSDLGAYVPAVLRRAWRRGRTFSTRRFRDLMRNTTIAEVARSWVFVLGDGEAEPVQAFRPADGEYLTLDGDLRLPVHGTVRIATRELLTDSERRAWDLHLAEHEIVQTSPQW